MRIRSQRSTPSYIPGKQSPACISEVLFCLLSSNIVYPYSHTDPERESENSSSVESALARVGPAPQEVAGGSRSTHASLEH